YIERIEIAGPGFLNFFLTKHAYTELVHALTTDKAAFFKLDPGTHTQNYNIEFVSANPTGPVHLGHGRGGIIGDVLGNIVLFLGHRVTKEFYINDAGVQVQKLGASLKARCQQQAGIDAQLPEDGYQGEYLVDLARECIQEHSTLVLKESDEFFQEYAKEKLLHAIKKVLHDYGINFDVWFSEKSLHTNGSIERTLHLLQEHGHLFEHEGALWFRSTAFGDDKDRVLRKSSGELTYVAADSAYMQNKANRGFTQLIMVLGHDHHGYEERLQGLRKALDIAAPLHIVFYQLVKMKASGQLVRMSKRAGNIVTLSDVIETVGTDVARFFYLNRKADAQLEFDLDLALKRTDENPVYYVQYAYVRTGSIFAKAAQSTELHDITTNDAQYIGQEEQLLIKKIAALRPLLESIAHTYQTHVLTYYALELAQTFHSYYAKNKVIDLDNLNQSRGRLLMVQLTRNTLGMTFDLLGISKPEKM
ncbi:MAG: arginine--tRNA ligase, partial [Candidatus Babeliales bacterium]